MNAGEVSVWAVLRRNIAPLYFPMGAVTLGGGILLPVVPLYLADEGISLSMIGLIIASTGIGAALIGIPASAFSERFGNDRLTFSAIVAVAASAFLFGFTDAVILLFALRILWGFGFGGFTQSRQLFIARTVATPVRGRVNSFIGGTNRLAFVIGPLIGGTIADRWGFQAAFVVAGTVIAGGLVWSVLPGGPEERPDGAPIERIRVGPAMRRHRRLLLRVGLGPMLIIAARQGRYVVIPLIGDQLELSASAIGTLVAVGTAADFLLFPVAGYVMDRFGRLHAMVPAFTLMSAGLVLLGLADSTGAVVVATVVIGMGNGLSAGTILTLGTDLAPVDAQGPFLAGFSLMGNAGHFVGPAAVGWSAGAIGLDVSAFVLAALLLCGVAWIALVIGETGERADQDPEPNRTTDR